MSSTDQEQITDNSRGAICSPSECYSFIQHVMEYNLRAVESGTEKLVACIWGVAGISKTATIKQLGKTGVTLNGERIYPKVKHVALAQIEEAGDITGLPYLDNDGELDQKQTNYAPPSWWPEEGDGHTILLFDDFNRADPRILKAIMQLLQDYRTNVNDLPENTHIMLTGNPSDQGDYMVNEIDKAILTRMLHITMKFDKNDWTRWATAAKLDKRVISFVLRHEEMCDGTRGTRTNPRSVVQFGRLIEPIQNLKENSEQLNTLARSCLDDAVAAAFEKFVLGDYQMLVDPEQILNNFNDAIKKIESLKQGTNGRPREDLIGIIMDRFFAYLMQDNLGLNDQQKKNFVEFMKRGDLITDDMVYMFLRRLRAEAMHSGDDKKNAFIVDLVNSGDDELADKLVQIL